MPKLKFYIPLVLLLAGAAPAAQALSGSRVEDVCDRAARHAARANDVPLDILLAITRTETGRTIDGHLAPWPWTVNLEGKGFWFASEVEAKTFVFDVFKAGARSFDVGCFQINYRWHGKAFRSIDAMFDPNENAAYAAQFLKELHDEHGTWPQAVGAYHSRTPDLAHAYSHRFQTILADLGTEPKSSVASRSYDPFSRVATSLIPLQSARPGASRGVLGSLVPIDGSATAFIAFDQE